MAAALSSCKDDYYDNTPDEPLRVSVDTILVGNKVQKVTIGVAARDAGWTMTGSEDWCAVNPASGETGITQVTVTFTSNDGEDARSRTTTFTFTSGDRTKNVVVEQLNTPSIPLPNEHPDKPINEAIYEKLKAWYYNGEPESVSPDYNQSYDDFYFNYLSHLTRNEEFDGNIWSKNNERYIYSYIERNPVGTAAASKPRLNYGMEFDLGDFDGRMVARILYVEPGSPAAAAGLKRGDWFYKVGNRNSPLADGEVNDDLKYPFYYNRLIDSLVHPVRGESVKLGLLSYRAAPFPGALLDEGRSVTLTPAEHPNNPILNAQVIEDKRNENSPVTGYTGYLMYNSFDPAYKNELIAEFTKFRNQPANQRIDKFILDLRYNKNGTVEMAELMGNLLVGDAKGVSGRTFASYKFNGKAPVADRTAKFASHPSGVGVDTVFVLTSSHTAGASELLINALKGLGESTVKLVMIGDTTQGLAAGMVKQTPGGLDPEWEYSAWMLAFRCYNDAEEGNYQYGFVGNGGEVREWDNANIRWSDTWVWKGRLGSNEDALLKRAMDIITGLQPYPGGEVINATQQMRRLGYPREFCFPTNMTMTIEE